MIERKELGSTQAQATCPPETTLNWTNCPVPASHQSPRSQSPRNTMPTVRFPRHLRRHVDIPDACELPGATAADIVAELARQYPAASEYLIDESGGLRQHVNLFIGDRMVRDRQRLSDVVNSADELTFMPALSGG